MASLNGGTEAPTRGRRRGRNGNPGMSAATPARGRKGTAPGMGGKIGIGGAGLTGPGGRQLEARVQSGAITSEQAQKTMQQRQTLAKALGPNWRDKLEVGGQSFARVNAGLKKNPGNAKLAAVRKKLITNRASLLESAAKKKKPAATTPASTIGE